MRPLSLPNLQGGRLTVIVGLLDSGKVWMGADSGIFRGWDVAPMGDAKVFHNGPFLIGGAGDARAAQLVRYVFVPPSMEGNDVARFMATNFAEGLRTCLKEGGVTEKDKEIEHQPNCFLVGFRGRLFTVGTTHYVGEVLDDFASEGIGADFARGSMATSSGSPESRITKALEVAARFSAGVRGPFFIKSLKEAD